MDFVTHAKLLLDDKINLINEENMVRVDQLCEIVGRLNEEADAPAFSTYYRDKEFGVELYFTETTLEKNGSFWEAARFADTVRLQTVKEDELPAYKILCKGDVPGFRLQFAINVN